jgi:AcrR family transcriptional regulator
VQMVEAILEAGVRVLKSVEMEKLSTRIVAKISGVSVGSLYQYFPNKEALVGTLLEREMKKQVETLENRYSQVRGKSFEVVISALCDELIANTVRDKLLLKHVFSNTFFLGRLDRLIEVRESLVNFVENVLIEAGIENNSYVKAYTIVATFPGILETITFRRSEPVSSGELSIEASKMICLYCKNS